MINSHVQVQCCHVSHSKQAKTTGQVYVNVGLLSTLMRDIEHNIVYLGVGVMMGSTLWI